MTLKIGDRARVYGEEGFEVTVVDPAYAALNSTFIQARFEGPSHKARGEFGLFRPYELEKIEPEPKFKAGDRVREKGFPDVLTVEAVRPNNWDEQRDRHPFLIRLAGEKRFRFQEWFELAEDEPRPLGLKAGDKVVNLKTGREGLVLKGPISGDLKVYDQKPPIKDAVPAQALEEYEFHYPGTYDVWRRVTREALVKKVGTPW